MRLWWKYQESWRDSYMDCDIFKMWINDSFKSVSNSTEIKKLKTKIYHSEWKKIVIQLKEPPEFETISETIIVTQDLISKIEKWLFIDNRLSLVCISENPELTYSFI